MGVVVRVSDQVWAQAIASLVGLGVLVVLRVVDALLPKGRHFRFVDRFLAPDDLPKHDEDERG